MRLTHLIAALGLAALCAAPLPEASAASSHASGPVALLTVITHKVERASHKVHAKVAAKARRMKHRIQRTQHRIARRLHARS